MRFFPRLWFCLALSLVVLLLSGCGLLALPAPRLLLDNQNGIAATGARGPITLAFSEPVQRGSVEAGFQINPPVEGRFTWAGDGLATADQTVSFWPALPLMPGRRYTVTLASSVQGKSGKTLRKSQSWPVEIRPADVVYLSPSQAPEIWRVSSDGSSRKPLTSTGGNIYDFNVSTDGGRVVYSVKNTEQGYDLWEVDRQGKNTRLLLPCGPDWCTGAAYSPAGTQIAYSRRRYSGLPGRKPETPQIWLLNLSTQATDVLLADPNISGSEPEWSPDGRYLAFYDGLSGGVHVQDMQAQAGFLMPAEEGSGIEWSTDSRSLLYTQAEVTNEIPYNSVYEVDAQTRQTRKILGDAKEPADYSVPDWSPDGEWAAVGWRLAGGSANKQLWMVRLNESSGNGERRAITSDEAYTNASYHWDPGGTLLVFQRLQVTGSPDAPEIVVWNKQDGKTLLLAEDAFQPQWMP